MVDCRLNQNWAGELGAGRYKAALSDVAAAFAQPGDILDATDLTREPKIELLEQWERDLNQLITASGEGMISTRPGAASARLQEVRKILTSLGV